MGLLTFNPVRGVRGLLGMAAMGRRLERKAPPHPEQFTQPVMGLPATPFPLHLSAPLSGRGKERAIAPPAPVQRPQQPRRPTQIMPQTNIASQLPAAVDWEFVRRRENVVGKPATVGYVPPDPEGNSGVTIASGLDLGQHSEHDLRRKGIPDSLVKKFKPFLLLRGPAADGVAGQLTISDAEAAEIDRYVFASTYRDVARQYNAASVPGLKFENLPPEAQTVIVSVAHQYGDKLAKNAPKFWSHVTNGRWQDADAELRNFGDSSGPRRKLEADLLAEAIKAGTLPRPALSAAP